MELGLRRHHSINKNSSRWMFEQMSRLADGFLPLIVLTNLPQALLSFIYLTYNVLITCMLLGEEWAKFAYTRKTLPVTCPVGKQRSTFWLQLPYSYGIPPLVMSMVLHWLVSLSFFVVRITVRDLSDLTQKFVRTFASGAVSIPESSQRLEINPRTRTPQVAMLPGGGQQFQTPGAGNR